MSGDQIVLICLGVYLVLGLPVAIYHMRQQNMNSSALSTGSKGLGIIVYVLACMWPLLLLSILLNHRNAKGKPGKAIANKPIDHSQAPIELPEHKIDFDQFGR